ncbi:unnamed protein product [Orchesella dallaii]|uniref:Uncharacterized protein n=1 Tax=Orchesella dallaii TaxID=48710 RepID=A0ABP1S6U8_9HEXA
MEGIEMSPRNRAQSLPSASIEAELELENLAEIKKGYQRSKVAIVLAVVAVILYVVLLTSIRLIYIACFRENGTKLYYYHHNKSGEGQFYRWLNRTFSNS